MGLSLRLETSAPAHASACPTLMVPVVGWVAFDCWIGNARPLGVAGRLTPGVILMQAKYKAREAALKAQSERKPGGEREDRGKLPESPKRAEEIWQQSVIGDYLARFKVARSGKGVVLQPAHAGLLQPQVTPPTADSLSVPRMTG